MFSVVALVDEHPYVLVTLSDELTDQTFVVAVEYGEEDHMRMIMECPLGVEVSEVPEKGTLVEMRVAWTDKTKIGLETRRVIRKTSEHDTLVEEAKRWANGELDPRGWVDAPEAAPRHEESELVSLRLPVLQVAVLKEFARRTEVSFSVLMKRWIDDRIRSDVFTSYRD